MHPFKKAFFGSVCVEAKPHRSPLLCTNEAIAWLQNYIELVGLLTSLNGDTFMQYYDKIRNLSKNGYRYEAS